MVGEETLQREIESLLKKYNQLTREGLYRLLREADITYTFSQLCKVLGKLLDEDKITITKW